MQGFFKKLIENIKDRNPSGYAVSLEARWLQKKLRAGQKRYHRLWMGELSAQTRKRHNNAVFFSELLIH